MKKKQPAKQTTPTAEKAAGVSDTSATAEYAATATLGTNKDDNDKTNDDKTSAGGEDNQKPETLQEVPAAASFGITEQTVIVIAAVGEAAELLLRVWGKTAAPADIRFVSPAATLAETLESLVADDLVPDEIIFVPGICVPTAKVSLADLTLYRRRVFPKGETADYTGLPMHLTKENTVKTLEAFETDPDSTDENLVRHYNKIAHVGEIPNQVAFSFGNGVGYVARPDFCPSVLIEFLLRRKFVCLSPEAFSSAKRYLEEYAR